MTPALRILFGIAERLHVPVTTVEAMSVREVQGWVDYWQERSAGNVGPVDDATDLGTLSRSQLKAMFPGAKR